MIKTEEWFKIPHDRLLQMIKNEYETRDLKVEKIHLCSSSLSVLRSSKKGSKKSLKFEQRLKDPKYANLLNTPLADFKDLSLAIIARLKHHKFEIFEDLVSLARNHDLNKFKFLGPRKIEQIELFILKKFDL